jgi:hypothetical protein
VRLRWKADPVERDATAGDPLGRIQRVVYAGGHGVPLERGARFDLTFYERALVFSQRDRPPVYLRYDEIASIDVSGPGAYRQGPTFVGGGFGLQGAAEGMLIAGVLNALAGSTKIESILRVAGPKAEVFLVTDAATPRQLMIELSPIRALLRGTARPQLPSGLTDELERLARLHDAGALTDAEFEAAKRKVIGGG